MDVAVELNQFSRWRLAAVVAAAVAFLELLLLIGVAGVKLAPSFGRHGSGATAQRVAATTPAAHRFTAKVVPLRVPAVRTIPIRPRRKLAVLVLNGNGVAGAAGALAERLLGHGYRRTASTNAPSHDYARSLVLFAPGYLAEAKRLARDAHVRAVATGDGRLRGYRLVVILGGR